MPQTLELQLLNTKIMNEHTVHMSFKILHDESLEFEAGQFLRLLFEQDGTEVFRSYSIANIWQENQNLSEVELAVSWVKGGLATERLSAMQPGDSIKASAPYGRFCLPEKSYKRYFLVATGTGVTPYRAMQNQLFEKIEQGSEVFVVMGARDESGLLYADEFTKNAEANGYHYITCQSRVKLENPTANEFEGHVQTYLQTVDFDSETDIVFLCGNPDMVDQAFHLLKEKGLPVPQIRREKYVSPPKPKPKKSILEIK